MPALDLTRFKALTFDCYGTLIRRLFAGRLADDEWVSTDHHLLR